MPAASAVIAMQCDTSVLLICAAPESALVELLLTTFVWLLTASHAIRRIRLCG